MGEWSLRGAELKVMKRVKKKNRRLAFTTRQGLLLSLSIAAFVAIIFLMVYYVYVLPMQKSLE
jgi:hypothetical protein